MPSNTEKELNWLIFQIDTIISLIAIIFAFITKIALAKVKGFQNKTELTLRNYLLENPTSTKCDYQCCLITLGRCKCKCSCKYFIIDFFFHQKVRI